MAFHHANGVDASGSTFNDVRDQINIGRDQIIFNFSDMSSDSVVSSTSGRSNNYYSAPADAKSASFSFTRRRRHHHPDDYYSSDGAEQYPVARTGARQEDTRSKRIAREQKRREDLKEGYETLKIELPDSNLHSSKLSLLRRGK
jgi:hypothetical protein